LSRKTRKGVQGEAIEEDAAGDPEKSGTGRGHGGVVDEVSTSCGDSLNRVAAKRWRSLGGGEAVNAKTRTDEASLS